MAFALFLDHDILPTLAPLQSFSLADPHSWFNTGSHVPVPTVSN